MGISRCKKTGINLFLVMQNTLQFLIEISNCIASCVWVSKPFKLIAVSKHFESNDFQCWE